MFGKSAALAGGGSHAACRGGRTQYHGVVREIPRLGTNSTTAWYKWYQAVVAECRCFAGITQGRHTERCRRDACDPNKGGYAPFYINLHGIPTHTTMKEERANFGSKIGMILATAGSAVGLGNIWRFPYMAGEHGGAAFILVYAACIALLGIPCMVAEFVVGRHGAANASRAYARIGGHKAWKGVGVMGVVTGFAIISYYTVVSGWCLQYVWAAAAGQLEGSPESISAYFESFSKDPVRPALWAVAFMLGTHFVIIHGVRGGIERASKLLMPALFALLLAVVAAACTLPGAGNGVEFLLKPDFSKIDGSVLLGALGQAFYSLSIGMGCICTYASYYSRQTDLVRSAVQISFLDSLVAILAGLVIFPAAFSVGISPDSGPSLTFITLPNVFQQAFSGSPAVWLIASVSFYVLLSLAAFTSLISLHEVCTAFISEELHMSRRKGAAVVTAAGCLLGVLCALSVAEPEWVAVAGMPLFDFFDFTTGQILLPLGGLLTCIVVGWWAPKAVVRDQFTNWGTVNRALYRSWIFLVGVVCPVLISAIFVNQLFMS